jgi:hypothetical protein
MLFSLLSVFSSTKLENKTVEQVLPGSGDGGMWGCQVDLIMFAHVSKCKNNK